MSQVIQIPYEGSAMIAQGIERTSRKTRRPKHSWQVAAKPWTIQPILIAPVIPGETLTMAMYQARCVSDPIKNPLIGWWQEYYYFYVKLRDLDDRATLTEMMIDPSVNLSALFTVAKADTYHYASSYDFVQRCLERVVKEYFREEGEPYAGAGGLGVITGMPLAKVVPPKNSWMDSLLMASAVNTANNLEDGPNDSEFPAYAAAYERMRAMRMIDMTYDDWLATFGIDIKPDMTRKNVPELIKYHRDWTYPANTVEPTTGIPSSAMSWAVSDRLDKDRFFREPGFIFGVTISRPKVYLANQRGAAVHLLDTPEAWLPRLLADHPETSLRLVLGSTTAGILAGQAATPGGDWWVDIADLYRYGDQFTNIVLDGAANGVPMPSASVNTDYVTEAARDLLFTGVARAVRQDGVMDLTIKCAPSTAMDQT